MQDLENYKKEKLTIDIVWANVFGILILIPIGLIFGLPFYLIWRPEIDIKQLLDSLGPQGAIMGFMLILGILIFGMFFIMAAGGDLLIINLIRKEKSTDLVQDHPSEAGCYIYRKIE